MGTRANVGLWVRITVVSAVVGMVAACSGSGSDGPPTASEPTRSESGLSEDSGDGGAGLFVFGGKGVGDRSFITNDLRGSLIEIGVSVSSIGKFTDISFVHSGTAQVAPPTLALPIDDDSAFVAGGGGAGNGAFQKVDFETGTIGPLGNGRSPTLYHPDHPGVLFGRSGDAPGDTDVGCFRIDSDGEATTLLDYESCWFDHSGKVLALDSETGELVVTDLDAEPGDEVRMTPTARSRTVYGVDDTGTLAWILTDRGIEMFDAETGDPVAVSESDEPQRVLASASDVGGILIETGGSSGTDFGVEPQVVYFAPDGSSVELDQTGETPASGVMVGVDGAWVAPDATSFLLVHQTFGADGISFKLDQFDADGTYVETLFEGAAENEGSSPSALPSFYLDVFEGPDEPIIVWRIRPLGSDVWEPYLGTLGGPLEELPEEEDVAEPRALDRTEPDLAFVDPETGDVAFVNMVRVRYVSGGDPTDVTDVALRSFDEPGDTIRVFGDGRIIAGTQSGVVRIDADGETTIIDDPYVWDVFGLDDDGNIVLSYVSGATALCDGEDCSDPARVTQDDELLAWSAVTNPSFVFGMCTAIGPGFGEGQVVRTCARY